MTAAYHIKLKFLQLSGKWINKLFASTWLVRYFFIDKIGDNITSGMEGKQQQQLVIIDAGQSLFIERPRYGSTELTTSQIDAIVAKTKLDTVGLDELATLSDKEYKFVFLISTLKTEYMNRIR